MNFSTSKASLRSFNFRYIQPKELNYPEKEETSTFQSELSSFKTPNWDLKNFLLNPLN